MDSVILSSKSQGQSPRLAPLSEATIPDETALYLLFQPQGTSGRDPGAGLFKATRRRWPSNLVHELRTRLARFMV